MVDLHANKCIGRDRGGRASGAAGDRREGKVKNLMDRTPGFIKTRFWSVLGSSNDLINGLTNKVMRHEREKHL